MSVRNGNDRKAFLHKAALEYMTAAKCFPEDDEQRPCTAKQEMKLRNIVAQGKLAMDSCSGAEALS
ncbi:hypothetical protein B0H19DRAFT_1259594 [Mycena capillaripes]|nr:hypothetical protein B0H19DRAFT_1259594 [Mycena capillaripes]